MYCEFLVFLLIGGVVSIEFVYLEHEMINPWTGGVSWVTDVMSEVLAMEWTYIGVSQVLPDCNAGFDWTILDDIIDDVASRDHQVIIRPIFFGPGYGVGSYPPVNINYDDFEYDGNTYQNPIWSQSSTQTCVFKFIDAFCERYKDNTEIAYVQMGLSGLWGEHHLDGSVYTDLNFPNMELQQQIIQRWIDGMGSSSGSISLGISLDSTQEHGAFLDDGLDGTRFHFFDDTLLDQNHKDINWRQNEIPTAERLARAQYGYGGEVFWSGCNSDSSWVNPPFDCGNGESLPDQAARLKLNYFLGSDAFETKTPNEIRTVAKQVGYDFWIKSINFFIPNAEIEICNAGVAHSPYLVQLCISEDTTGTNQQCEGDLSTLPPNQCTSIEFVVSGDQGYEINLESPRLNPNVRIYLSNEERLSEHIYFLSEFNTPTPTLTQSESQNNTESQMEEESNLSVPDEEISTEDENTSLPLTLFAIFSIITLLF